MMRQIRLPDHLARVESHELIRLYIIHGRADIPPRIIRPHPASRSPGHGITPRQPKGAMFGIHPHARTRAHGDGERQFLGRHCAVSADVTSCDAPFLLAEDVGGEDVDDAHDDDDDAGGDDDAPVGGAKGGLGGGFLVEVAEDGDAEDGHEDAEGEEAVGGREEGPVAGEVGAEERGFGEEEKHC